MGNSDVELVSSHCAAIRWSSIVVFLILLFVNFITLVTCSANNVVGGVADDHRHQSRVDLAELRHNIIKGLKLKKLPDMTKVCKHANDLLDVDTSRTYTKGSRDKLQLTIVSLYVNSINFDSIYYYYFFFYSFFLPNIGVRIFFAHLKKYIYTHHWLTCMTT